MNPPELVLLGARVHTGLSEIAPQGSDEELRAVAVAAGIVQAVGTAQEAREWAAAGSELIDLGAATITAGFVDAHVHPLSGAESRFRGLQLQTCASLEEAAQRLAEHASAFGPNEWVRAFGLSLDLFGDGPVSNEPFIQAFDGRPGYLLVFDGHSIIASPRALEIGGVDGPREFTTNASVEVDENGVPTGYLVESDAERLVLDHYPRMPFAQRVDAVSAKLKDFAASGYTSLHQMNYDDEDMEVLRALEEREELPVRLRVSPLFRASDPWNETLQTLTQWQAQRGRRWKIEGVKLMLDGTVDNGSAWLAEPDTRGAGTEPYWIPHERFTQTVHALAQRGIPTATHAIGDRAVEFVLDAIESIPPHFPRLTHRVEHIETLPDHLVPRFAELGVIASMQPMHAFAMNPQRTDTWSARLGTGSRRALDAWRIADLEAAGAVIALGSDWPVEEFDARAVFASNVTRRRPGTDMDAVDPQQALSPAATLRAITQGPWAAIGRPREGLIVPGAVADLVAFELDPLASDPEDFATSKVLLTLVQGRRAHSA